MGGGAGVRRDRGASRTAIAAAAALRTTFAPSRSLTPPRLCTNDGLATFVLRGALYLSQARPVEDENVKFFDR